jgi:hypothetical protein
MADSLGSLFVDFLKTLPKVIIMEISFFLKKNKDVENDNGLNITYYDKGKGPLCYIFEKRDGEKDLLFQHFHRNGNLWSSDEYSKGKRVRRIEEYEKTDLPGLSTTLEDKIKLYKDEKEKLIKLHNTEGRFERQEMTYPGKMMINKAPKKTLNLDGSVTVSYDNELQVDEKQDQQKASETNLRGDQKMLFVIYPKLKGIDFSSVKFGASGNSPAEFFASDIDGDWHYAQSQMIMLFKAFSKDKIESELKLLLNQNEINLDDKIEKTELLAEHWKGDGFKIEHPVIEGIDIIIITNEDMVPESSLTLQKTNLAPEVKLPTGYENIGIEHVYDGSKFLKANQGQFSLNIPLLFKDNDESTHYIIIGVSTLTLAKHFIDEIIEKNYGKQYFKELDEKDGWQYIYANKFFTIGFLSKYHCVRINMLHNLIDIRKGK